MKPIQHISIASAGGRSYVSQKPIREERLCPLKFHVPKAYRLLWHCHWGWVEELSQLEYYREEKQQWAKLCYFAVLGLDPPFMCPILHLQKFGRYNTAEKKWKYIWTYIALSFSFEGCQAYDKHDRNLHRGWFIISLEVQILSHLVQKDANSERGWLCRTR